MTTTNKVQKQPNLQNLYDKAATDIQNGNTQGAQKTIQRAAGVYAKQNPGSTVQDFESAFCAAESGKVSSGAINNVVNSILPSGEDASTASIGSIAAQGTSGSHGARGKHGGGGGGDDVSTSSTTSTYDPTSGTYITT